MRATNDVLGLIGGKEGWERAKLWNLTHLQGEGVEKRCEECCGADEEREVGWEKGARGGEAQDM